jgi:hypothetical protein
MVYNVGTHQPERSLELFDAQQYGLTDAAAYSIKRRQTRIRSR